MYLQTTTIDLFKFLVINYKNDRGFDCSAKFHFIKNAVEFVKELRNSDRIDIPSISITKENYYWKDAFYLTYYSDAEFTDEEIDLIKENTINIIRTKHE